MVGERRWWERGDGGSEEMLVERRCWVTAINREECWKNVCRSRWPSSLRRGSADARLLGLLVRIPPAAWMSICCECCVLSGRGLCDGPIARPEESYRLWCVIVCDLNKQ